MAEKPTIFFTGAAGNCGQVLIPQLLDEGFRVRTYDVAQVDYPTERIVGSVTDYATLRPAMQHMNIVVHMAGLHNQLPRSPQRPDAYDVCYDVNVTGTHHVLRAAVEAGVQKIIFISSMAYYAYGAGYCEEDWPAQRPADNYYSLSKVIGEDLCRYYAGHHGLPVIALRPGNFTGLPSLSPAMLDNRLRREDVAHAIRCAIDYEPDDDERFDAFTILAGNPFGPDDVAALRTEPMTVLEKYYPGAAELLEQQGEGFKGMSRVPSIRKAREKLNYQPKHTFEAYLAQLGYRP